MADVERRQHTATCWGRLKDELTREVIPVRAFEASIPGAEPPLYKDDGYFVFSDLAPPAAPRQIHLAAASYRPRTLSQVLPAGAPLGLSFDGEDELYVVVKTVNAGTGRVTFDPIPFLPTVPQGALVIGEAGFVTTLAAVLEGESAAAATLASVAGLAANTVLRFRRSGHLVLRPGAGYAFSPDQTVIAVAVLDAADSTPLTGATVSIDRLNGAAPANVTVGTLSLVVATFGTQHTVLGPVDAVTAAADARGWCVFYFPASLPITQLRLSASNTGYVTQTQTLAVTAGARTSQVVSLVAA